MSYSIAHDETIDAAIRRIADEQIVRAREHLQDAELSADKRVHETRKRFKEMRALLRLVRAPLGDQFTIENAWFRDAARDLASVRDADAVLEALADLELPARVRNRVRRRLRRDPDHARLAGLTANTVQQLAIAQARVALWPPMDDAFHTLSPGLVRTYRDARRTMKHARSAKELHEWRKHVKTHWYHLQLTTQVWPALMKALSAELKELSQALGHHHDLDVLSGMAGEEPGLAAAIAARQRKMERDAHGIGVRAFAEKPDAWLARMRNYWTSWKGP